MKLALLVGLGGFLGSIFRYALSRFLSVSPYMTFPWATFIVNMLGCFIIGLLIGWFTRAQDISAECRLFLTVGFCGGFTTFSTFATESLQLLRSGAWLHFSLYTCISVFAGILLTALGVYLMMGSSFTK